MTTMLEALGTRLATDGVGTLGTDLFLSHMPESPDACVAIYEYGGSVPEMTMGAGLYAINRPRVQVKVRTAREDYPGEQRRLRMPAIHWQGSSIRLSARWRLLGSLRRPRSILWAWTRTTGTNSR